MRANYHTHTLFCDGKADSDTMAAAAFAAGYRVLGFSSHAPLPFHTGWTMREEGLLPYFAEVRAAREAWSGRGLEILLGLEIDWIEGIRSPSEPLFADADLDFRICSVHFVGTGRFPLFTVDSPGEEFEAEIRDKAGGDGTLVYRAYYEALSRAIEAGGFDILGHLDLVTKNNVGGRWFDEESRGYLDAALGAVELLKDRGIVVEINLGAMNRGRKTLPYPSLPIMRRLRELRVPITICADAHDTPHFGANLGAARELALAAGYASVAILSQGSWKEVGIEET